MRLDLQISDNQLSRKLLVNEDTTPYRYNTGKFSIVEIVDDQSLTLQSGRELNND